VINHDSEAGRDLECEYHVPFVDQLIDDIRSLAVRS
jgi:hypothetical protein